MFELAPQAIIFAGIAAFIVGFSKAGLPGAGILVVPLMAHSFGSRLSIGATLPMLITGDICAVWIHHSEIQWSHLRRLAPTVVVGLIAGTWFLLNFGKPHVLNVTIGSIVLGMLAITLMRKKFGDKLVPTSTVGVQVTGGLAGFTTMTANAAGPIMSIYMTAAKLTKQQLISTSAVYFMIFNLVKVPLIIFVTKMQPSTPLLSSNTLAFDAAAIVLIVAGALTGKRLFKVIPQDVFSWIIMALAAVASILLILS